MLPRAFGAAALLAALLAPALAAAAEDREISGDQTLGGEYTFDTFTVTETGKLHVPHLAPNADGGAPDGGWLHIRANVIKILGLIEADGAGHAGVDGANGDAPATTSGGGGKGAAPGFPGGGGAFFGAGANGSSEATAGACATYGASSPGGIAFFDMAAKAPSLGAAGGAANVMPTTATAGGSGGGGIILEAALVQIDGTVTANGVKRFATSVGPGGGSGGTIQIVAAALQGAGQLEVRGGDGAHGNGSTNPANPIAPNNGGGGGGGVIILRLPSGFAIPSTLTLTTTGGRSGDCTDTGGDGAVVMDTLPGGCVDLDGDGFASAQCGGDDCDDSEAAIHPGVDELCDGKDNDCNASVDDGDELCPPGTMCVSGGCKANPDAGGGDAGGEKDTGAPPDHLELGGGCSLPATGGLAEGAAGAAAFALAAMALAAGRRPRRRARRR